MCLQFRITKPVSVKVATSGAGMTEYHDATRSTEHHGEAHATPLVMLTVIAAVERKQ